MKHHPETFLLNGRKIFVDKFLRSTPETKYESDLLAFIREWYAPCDYIEVQTSGSTGKPKSINLSKSFVVASAERTLQYFGLQERDKVLHCLPCQYIAGKLMIVRALIGRLDLYMVDPSTDFNFLEQQKFRFAAMVSNQLASISDNLLPQIDHLLIGGSAIPSSLQKRLENIQSNIYSSYAMTETATHIAICRLNGKHADGWYHCMDNIQVSLTPRGCLQIEMPGLPLLQTTDIAELKDNKTFRISGRADYVVISGGLKYHPEQLERKLESYIKQPFMITSTPHDVLGEQITLVLEGTPCKDTENHIMEICRQHLTRYEQPRLIRFLDMLPRTPNGKLIRKV